MKKLELKKLKVASLSSNAQNTIMGGACSHWLTCTVPDRPNPKNETKWVNCAKIVVVEDRYFRPDF